jgi:hypothetical protein
LDISRQFNCGNALQKSHGIDQMFIEFKNDGTYLTNGFNHAEGKVEGIERGTFVFDAKTDLTFLRIKQKPM